ncbi:OmpA/MotB family protein [Larsenimonas suaedae]|uniref:OmpA family protein n=1 Tax=Larsenimonas suaedae TaxID=1851019 RepID=A0ABU1GW78_9GAMM|nr:OmpA family protein [Larsenimonas suaedae]MCM2973187.1 OmpA family protein [Larsenimonas suaedae]MDR5896080.1 OmpA family protein [Larsenimonas suaedae]
MFAKRLDAQSEVEPVRRAGAKHDALDDAESPIEQAGWLISYLDVLTLLIMLFIILLMFNRPADEPEPPIEAPMTGGIMPLHRGIQPMVNGEVVGPAKPARQAIVETPGERPAPSAHVFALSPEALMAVGLVTAPSSAFTPPITPARSAESEPTLASESVPAVDRLEDMFPALEGVLVSPTPQGVTVRIQNQVLFSSGDVDISDSGERLLDRLVPGLSQFKGSISVEGHTDSRPISTERFPSNWELSTARASSVVRLLRTRGIDGERLRAVGLASTHPVADNDKPSGRAENRRVELVLKALP